jgi:hypothetical protein
VGSVHLMQLAKACFYGVNRDAASRKTSFGVYPKGSDLPNLGGHQHLACLCAFYRLGL